MDLGALDTFELLSDTWTAIPSLPTPHIVAVFLHDITPSRIRASTARFPVRWRSGDMPNVNIPTDHLHRLLGPPHATHVCQNVVVFYPDFHDFTVKTNLSWFRGGVGHTLTKVHTTNVLI